jgi:hypothetical protein
VQTAHPPSARLFAASLRGTFEKNGKPITIESTDVKRTENLKSKERISFDLELTEWRRNNGSIFGCRARAIIK